MSTTCTVPPANTGGEVICTSPTPDFWTGSTIAAFLSAFVAVMSVIVAVISTRIAHRAHQATNDARTSERERTADLALLGLYERLTDGTIRTARSALWTIRPSVTADPKQILGVQTQYFDLIWAMDVIYETLITHKIDREKAAGMLALHVEQIQQHIAFVHRTQEAPGAYEISNEKTWENYENNRTTWDQAYPELAFTHSDTGSTLHLDPAAPPVPPPPPAPQPA